MSSRLQRLFILLESGGSAVTRKAAAKQLGDVVKGKPCSSPEVRALLERLLKILSSKTWETRVAAAAAVGAILDSIPVWDPAPGDKDDDELPCTTEACVDIEAGVAIVSAVLAKGIQLKADHDTAGNDHQVPVAEPSSDVQRRRLNQQLGLDVAASLGMDTGALFSNEDLQPAQAAQQCTGKRRAEEFLTGLSQDSSEVAASTNHQVPEKVSKRCRLSSSASVDEVPSAPSEAAAVAATAMPSEWPLLWLCSELLNDVLSGSWETRHGAATSLRELLRSHGAAGGKRMHMTKQQLWRGHQCWLWVVAIRLVCVLALDTFGDYLADQVVAPVRETVAQALGVLCMHLSAPHVLGVVQVLQQLLDWSGSWTARHGGMLGLKYLLAARGDLRDQLLLAAYTRVYTGLSDNTDDVVGVAAECLTVCCTAAAAATQQQQLLGAAGQDSPLKSAASSSVSAAHPAREDEETAPQEDEVEEGDMVIDLDRECHSSPVKSSTTTITPPVGVPCSSNGSSEQNSSSGVTWLSPPRVQQLVARVWQSLLLVDDLSASTPALLLLLASLVKHQDTHTRSCGGEGSLSELVPRLFPFLYHASASVRRSALASLEALTTPPCTQLSCSAIKPIHSHTDSKPASPHTDSKPASPHTDIKPPSPHMDTNPPSLHTDIKPASPHTDIKPSCPDMDIKPSSPCTNFPRPQDSTLPPSLSITTATLSASKNGTLSSPSSRLGDKSDNVQNNGSHEVVAVHSIKREEAVTACEATESKSSCAGSSTTTTSTSITSNTTSGSCAVVRPGATCGAMTSFRSWCEAILSPLLRHLFQRSLVETCQDNLALIEQVWGQLIQFCSLNAVLVAACPLVSSWLCLAATAASAQLDPTLLLSCHRQAEESESERQPVTLFMGGAQHCRKQAAVACKASAARLLGELSLYVSQPMQGVAYQSSEEPLQCYTRLLLAQLRSCSAQQRITAAAVTREWAISNTKRWQREHGEWAGSTTTCCATFLTTSQYLASTVPKNSASTNGSAADGGKMSSVIQELLSTLMSCLTQPVYYDEIAMPFTRLQQDTKDFLALLKHYGVEVDAAYLAAEVLTLEQMSEVVRGEWLLQQLTGTKLRVKVRSTLDDRRNVIISTLTTTTATHETLTLATRAQVAGAYIRLGKLPSKLNPIVKPLMDSVKMEDSKLLQSEAGKDLSLLMELCVVREKNPNAKVVKNLSSFYCVDARYTPQLVPTGDNDTAPQDKYSGIYFLRAIDGRKDGQSCDVESVSVQGRRSDEGPVDETPVKRKRGRPPSKPKEGSSQQMPLPIVLHQTNQQELRAMSIQRRGCHMALQHIVLHCSDRLPSMLPVLWDSIMKPLLTMTDACMTGTTDGVNAAKSPFTLPVANSSERDSPNSSASESSRDVVDVKSNCNENGESASHAHDDMAAQEVVNWLQIVETVVPVIHSSLLEKICSHLLALEPYLFHRYCGVRHMAARVLGSLVTVADSTVMLFVLERLLPALSDMHAVLRRYGAVEALHMVVNNMALNILPYVVLLIVPLLASSSDPDCSVRAAGSQVFAALIRLLPLDGYMPDPPNLPVSVSKQRDEHRDFLHQLMDGNKAHHYKLPVTIAATLRDYQQAGVNWLAFLRNYGVHGILCDDMGLGKTLQTICILAATHHEYGVRSDATAPHVQSLVICPPTLTGHWVYEVDKYAPPNLLRPLHYCGPPGERMKMRQSFAQHNLIVASYDIVRNEIEVFAELNFLYIILDEGHIIKNTKTKCYQAMKRLQGRHRLILSGTPIQNNVLELWSLFDFLMPGYLGTEQHFVNKYSRPILMSRDAKASPSEQEAGVVAMEALHRQALPFMMRRLKEDVLKELPPKITQDYYCEMSGLQKLLYEDFLQTEGTDLEDDQAPKTHIFQALQYLRLVCNHPALVLRPQHPRYDALMRRAGIVAQDLHSISMAAKLPALKELLLECGVGGDPSADQCLVAQHRVLVFCQLRTMIDIIEKDLLKVHLPSVTYVRLDGSVPAAQRYGLVQQFNQDPSIDLMLLTTQVGGLGLNLTAADTVIFVEHDWNPMKDLQAMDRAHRIGQKRVVNVYRLITRNTLEEKIMGLQKFKLMTANTIISAENANINSMGTEQMLDLFSMENNKNNKKSAGSGGEGAGAVEGGVAPKAVLENLPELWDQSQYHDEYDIDKFLSSISS